jgi:hypothetical protein
LFWLNSRKITRPVLMRGATSTTDFVFLELLDLLHPSSPQPPISTLLFLPVNKVNEMTTYLAISLLGLLSWWRSACLSCSSLLKDHVGLIVHSLLSVVLRPRSTIVCLTSGGVNTYNQTT